MTMKVMVVDDEPPILDLMKAILEPLGCEVLTKADSREAAIVADKQKLDGIFLDVRMPHLDGFQLTEKIRQSNSNKRVPIVMLTGLDDAESMRRGFKAGITFFIGKPISKERIVKLFMAMRGSMLTEKRRYVRLPLQTTVTCESNKKSFKLSSINISVGGMRLEPTGALEIKQEFDMEFSLPQHQHPLKVRALVLHRHARDGMGIKFVNLSPEDREAIEGYISGAM